MLHPVIMCGGAGTRLWPTSRADRPKPFVPFLGGKSTFDLTLERIAALSGAAPPMAVAGPRHVGLIEAAFARASVAGMVLVEPEARDSGPAMAAAAWFISRQDPDGVCLFLAADHHIPDLAAFAAVVDRAARQAAQGGIVTLGVTPSEPSTAYGYIRPGEALGDNGVRRLAAFVEKPDAARAAEFIAEGYLWNSGMFIARADTLLSELELHAPAIAAATGKAVESARLDGNALFLGESFRQSPKVSIDYAVMEVTERALVAPADFAWSDLGAWGAILQAMDRDGGGNATIGTVELDRASGCLVHAAPGLSIAVAGARDLAIIAERGQIMICDLTLADSVKALVERVQARTPPAIEAPALWRDRFDRWMDASALPLWWAMGADHQHGGFQELLGTDGRPVPADRRLRVQGRQTHVFAEAGRGGWPGPWRQAVEHGLDGLGLRYRRADGLYRTLVDAAGAPKDNAAKLYDQAFVLLALASACRAGVRADWAAQEAAQLLDRVRSTFGRPEGGFIEDNPRPFQSNPHMHLLEAALAWMEAGGGPAWARLATEIVDLALSRFIDADGAFLREFFGPDWSPSTGADGAVVEPGHQFEWAWLLARWSQIAGRYDALGVAERLYGCGDRGVDVVRGVALDQLDEALHPAQRSARLWPQTERLKAATLLAQLAPPPRAERYAADSLQAAAGLWRYMDGLRPGLYRDRMTPSGLFVDEPCPASSLYHIQGAVESLRGHQPMAEPLAAAG
jgi:mannose-1-phosphate guanylyltransferase/mannose-6-phosphate isomerase